MPIKKTIEDFISEARSIFGNKYDYSKVSYKNSTTKVEIICPKHGSFLKRPSDFINRKQACRECNGYVKWTWKSLLKKQIKFIITSTNIQNKYLLIQKK